MEAHQQLSQSYISRELRLAVLAFLKHCTVIDHLLDHRYYNHDIVWMKGNEKAGQISEHTEGLGP